MTGKERADATAALMSWFESQDINPTEAGGVLVFAAGVLVGEAARDKVSLLVGVEAFSESMDAYATAIFEQKSKRSELRPLSRPRQQVAPDEVAGLAWSKTPGGSDFPCGYDTRSRQALALRRARMQAAGLTILTIGLGALLILMMS